MSNDQLYNPALLDNGQRNIRASIRRGIARAIASGGGTSALAFSGTLAHGQIITFSSPDQSVNFGVREDVKPRYVNLGDSRNGSTLGRITADNFHAGCTVQTALKCGQMAGAIKHDASSVNGAGAFGQNYNGSPVRPIIDYTERWYDFSMTDPAALNSSGELNLKTNRYWAKNGTSSPSTEGNNLYIGYNPGDNGGNAHGNIRCGLENLTQPAHNLGSRWYPTNRPFEGFAWQSEEVVVQESDPGVWNGRMIHAWKAKQVNKVDTWVTRNEIFLIPITAGNLVTLDQISNGLGSINVIYYGYILRDDDYKGVYIGNAATIEDCTHLVRQPQTAWSQHEVSIYAVDTGQGIAGSYAYFRSDIESWVDTNGLLLEPN
jgi:hypothetical protein